MISFIIPCFNEEALIIRCIRSIEATAKDVEHEILVIDNASTDNTATLAAYVGAKVLYEPNKGVTRARQLGFVHAKYDLIAFIDADNELPEDWLHYALIAMQPNDVVAASGPVIYKELYLPKRLISFLFYCSAKLFHKMWPMIQGGNFILRKSALKQAGGFNTDIEFYGEDTDTAQRLSKVGKIVFDLDLWVYSSARRMIEEGMLRVGVRYIINYFSIWFFDKPWTTEYHDHR